MVFLSAGRPLQRVVPSEETIGKREVKDVSSFKCFDQTFFDDLFGVHMILTIWFWLLRLLTSFRMSPACFPLFLPFRSTVQIEKKGFEERFRMLNTTCKDPMVPLVEKNKGFLSLFKPGSFCFTKKMCFSSVFSKQCFPKGPSTPP